MIEERNRTESLSGALLCYLIALSMLFMPVTLMAEATWLAGDHHIHSNNSVGWDESNPPKPICWWRCDLHHRKECPDGAQIRVVMDGGYRSWRPKP